jgi:hypothetical protein
MKNLQTLLQVGDQYNDFTIIDLQPLIIDRRQQIKVKCNCGKSQYIRPDRLISGQTKSCWECANLKKKGKITVFVGDLCSKIYLDIKNNAKIRNLEFLVSMEFLWELYLKQGAKCALSGLDIKLKLIDWKGKGTRKDITASLDRIDSTKAYTEDNVQWVHK